MDLLALAKDPAQVAKAAELVYVSDMMPGISRQKKGNQFNYVDAKRETINDEVTIARIQKMALPPAWEKVWICAKPNGHLQATGIDTKNRKQYRYHANWNAIRSETKFFRMVSFGEKLPLLRERLEKDIKQTSLNRNKVIAIALSVIGLNCIDNQLLGVFEIS